MRLIDADALGIGRCNPDVFDDKEYAKGWNSAIEILQEAPTIDAVPVVRCKDCVWCDEHGYCDKNEMFVENREWFCADGERIENG